MEDDENTQPKSDLPYDRWTEEALRIVALRALEYAANHGLPGEHHFYVTFRTDQPGVVIPSRLLAKHPQEMTIVLQHQFWDLAVDHAAMQFRVGLSFSGVGSILVIPFAAMTGFADPHVRFGLRFTVGDPAAEQDIGDANTVMPLREAAPVHERAAASSEEQPAEPDEAESPPAAEVVSLDKFRRRKE